MSYILDALKKADTERERSAVPGLHAQADAGFGLSDRSGGLPWRVIALAAIVLLAALLAWLWFGGSDTLSPVSPIPAPLAEAVPTPRPAPAPATPPTAAAPVAPAPTTVPSSVGQAAPVAPPQPAAAPPMAKPAPPPVPAAAEATRPPPTLAAKPPSTATAAAPKAAAAASAAAEPRLPTRNELPAELRAALPPLSISGAVYAPQASGRMLFVNGLVLREGDAVADGLTVERIGASSSVLAFRGQRFELKH